MICLAKNKYLIVIVLVINKQSLLKNLFGREL